MVCSTQNKATLYAPFELVELHNQLVLSTINMYLNSYKTKMLVLTLLMFWNFLGSKLTFLAPPLATDVHPSSA